MPVVENCGRDYTICRHISLGTGEDQIMNNIIQKTTEAIDKVVGLTGRAGPIFTQFDRDRILRDAARAQKRVSGMAAPHPLAGKRVSIKDLFDEEGEVTTAGSQLLRDRPAASSDSVVVARLKDVGAIMFGRTSMSEFAYSGTGLNPHHGTPGNIYDEKRIPGGSSSGAALSIALGWCDFAIGTDTGGSVRIPAAANGLFGFEPTQKTVPLDGVHPLSRTLDSAGPLAADLPTIVAAYEVMSATTPAVDDQKSDSQSGLRLAIPLNAFVNDLDDQVEEDYAAMVSRLRSAGHKLDSLDLAFLQNAIGVNRVIVAAEAYDLYKNDLDRLEVIGDPRVLQRIRFAETLSQQQIDDAYGGRNEAVSRFNREMDGFDALVTPSLQTIVPTIEETRADFDRLNAAMLRNPSLINLADGCSLVMPIPDMFKPEHGQATCPSMMLSAAGGRDWRLLGVAQALQQTFNTH